MIVTVFRNRLSDDPDAQAEYAELIGHISQLATTMPGYISHKTYVADDGERCTIVEFEHEDGQAEWRRNAEHAAARVRGREAFYSEYRIQICEELRSSHWSSDEGGRNA